MPCCGCKRLQDERKKTFVEAGNQCGLDELQNWPSLWNDIADFLLTAPHPNDLKCEFPVCFNKIVAEDNQEQDLESPVSTYFKSKRIYFPESKRHRENFTGVSDINKRASNPTSWAQI